jgi:hypothetical protein
VDADEDVLLARDVALDHRNVMLVVDQRAISHGRELAVGGRQPRRDDALDELLGLPPVGDQVGDGDHLQAVALAVGHEVGHPGHRPVLVHDLADHAGRDQAGQPREVDAGLRVARPLEHAAGLGLEREDVAGLDDVLGPRVRVDRDLDGAGAVVGRDPGGHALRGLDRDGERGLQRLLVLGRHQVEPQLVAALGRQREADQPARLLGHEVDRLGSGELRREHQVALVLAVLAVADDHHSAAADLLDGLLDRGEGAGAALSARAGRIRSAFGHLAAPLVSNSDMSRSA